MSERVDKYETTARMNGIPEEIFVALPIIENAGKIKGVSPKGARGPFGIMPATARSLGWKTADADDPAKAHFIAAGYLKDLEEELGSIEGALVAYNKGPSKAKKHGRYQESDYVHRVLAAAKILENPERYGVDLKSRARHFSGHGRR